MTQPVLVLDVKDRPDHTVEVRVEARDVPGPAGFGKLMKIEADAGPLATKPEIDSAVLFDKPTLLAFLRRLVAGGTGPIEVVCLTPRLPDLVGLLDAAPGQNPIQVDLGAVG